MHLQRLRGDAGHEDVVLDLLVQEHEGQHDETVDRIVHHCDEHRERAREVGAHDRDELRDDADPQRERERVRHAEDREHDPVTRGRQQREDRSRVQVAAGLVDRELPRLQHDHLSFRWQHRADGAPEARPVGDQIEREQGDREDLEHHRECGEAGFQRVPGEIFDEGAGGTFGVVELLGEIVEVHVGIERVVDPVLDAVHVFGCLVDEVADLADDDRTDRGDEHDREQEDDAEHETGRRAAPPAAAGERVHRGFDREREEQRDDQRDQERAQRDDEALDQVDEDEAEPEQRDALRAPTPASGRALASLRSAGCPRRIERTAGSAVRRGPVRCGSAPIT